MSLKNHDITEGKEKKTQHIMRMSYETYLRGVIEGLIQAYKVSDGKTSEIEIIDWITGQKVIISVKRT
ncbi:hypothetical protein [Pyrobaculum neutrophilum]|uniref:hypothetical protein n=1 Tax=Pyrobaculum neutrophilum TaxID=70771 RepID=UPI000322973C|nr:hypothetical protein [Pyrobaculum neutrophilum]